MAFEFQRGSRKGLFFVLNVVTNERKALQPDLLLTIPLDMHSWAVFV